MGNPNWNPLFDDQSSEALYDSYASPYKNPLDEPDALTPPGVYWSTVKLKP